MFKTAEKRDYYDVLGVDKNAGEADIKSAYRKLARQHHPDANPGDPGAEERFKEINEAYSILSDSKKRSRYDRYGHDAERGGFGTGDFTDFNPFDIFNSFFGGAFGGFSSFGQNQRRGPSEGADIELMADLTLEEVLDGTERSFDLNRVEGCTSCSGTGAKAGTRPQKCPKCNGTGQVRSFQQTFLGTMQSIMPCGQCAGTGSYIAEPCPDCDGQGRLRRGATIKIQVPPGVDNGMVVRAAGQGHAGARGGRPGDALIHIRVKAHDKFTRQGNDLAQEQEISFPQAALGAKLTVPTLKEQVEIKVPAGTQAGKVLTVKGKGLPSVRGGSVGDMKVLIRVKTPERISAKEKELYRQIAELGGYSVSDEQGVLDKLLGRRKR